MSEILEMQILSLANIERQKSLKFYETLLDFGLDSHIKSDDLNDDLRQNLREIFGKIAKKERESLANMEAIFGAISVDSRESNPKSNNAIILPSALPQNIFQELQNEMGKIDLKSLNILALGVESHHLKTCDFLLKHAQDSRTIDALYRLQALSYNHHIPLLQGEVPKENANLDANTTSANMPQITLQDLLNQSQFFGEIKDSLHNIQNFYTQTKNIVQKLERGELQKDELVAFLQKLHF